jgi:hypothetical protein
MSFWLARGGVFGLSTSKSALMRSRACLPKSRLCEHQGHSPPATSEDSSSEEEEESDRGQAL